MSLVRKFGPADCTANNGEVTDWNGIPCCAFRDVNGGTTFVEFGSGRVLHRSEVSGDDQWKVSLRKSLPVIVVAAALALFLRWRKR